MIEKHTEPDAAGKPKHGPYCYDYPRPAVTVDIVLFRGTGSQMEVLLIQRGRQPFLGMWALPGGFVDENEALEDAALRELEEETSLTGVQLTQIGAFGDPGRDPRGHSVGIAFLGFVDQKSVPVAGDDASNVSWLPAHHLPPLAFDHAMILGVALKQVQERVSRPWVITGHPDGNEQD
ncbi:MAG TPA: NUDIX hydrolase [Blastocatellia bacterium]|nr:NUDIX hydrolase [Blastocatellia bacterium]